MPDLEISKLPALDGTDLADTDVLPIVDDSASETKKINAEDLVGAGIKLVPDKTIPGEKLEDDAIDAAQLADDSVTADAIEDGAVGTDALAADAVTAAKIADSAVGTDALATDAVTANAIATGAVTADAIATGAVTAAAVAAGAIGNDELASGSVGRDNLQENAVGALALGDGVVDSVHLAADAVEQQNVAPGAISADKLDTVTDRGLDQATGSIGIANDTGADSTTANGIIFNRQGLITGTSSVTDLPPASDSTIGAVKPGTGLDVDADGTLNHSNAITASDIGGIEYDSEGHITSVPADGKLDPDAIPPAGVNSAEIGGVFVPAGTDVGLVVNATSGELTHEASAVAPGTYPKVTVGPNGHVTAGLTQIEVADLPTTIPTDRLDGQITNAQLGDEVVEAENIADYATCLMQEGDPGEADFLGQLWFKPSASQLYIYLRGSGPRNMWMPIGFGVVQQQNIRWAGLYDANTSTVVVATEVGIAAGLTAGASVPEPSDLLAGLYLVCSVPGDAMTIFNLNGVTHTAGDWIACVSGVAGWIHLDVTSTGGGGGVSTLAGLSDVQLTSPLDDQGLKYEQSSGLWRNASLVDGGTF